MSRSAPKSRHHTCLPRALNGLLAACLLAAATPSRAGTAATCAGTLGAPDYETGPLGTSGTLPATATLALRTGRTYLIVVDERDNDAAVEILDAAGAVLVRADSPERRSGTRHAIVTAKGAPSIVLRVAGKEHPDAAGSARISAFDLEKLQTRPDCLAAYQFLAQADADYAQGYSAARGHASTGVRSARDGFIGAVKGYSAAERAFGVSGDEPLRGRAALALAGIEYLDLQDWTKAADWAGTAARLLGSDPYRRARADALTAGAWIEIGSAELLARARKLLRRLYSFHLQRGERYDAGLQLSNVALTYLYGGRYADCLRFSRVAAELFGSLHETPRRAQAWMNSGVCLQDLDRLPEALRWFERALADIGPEPYPTLYVGVLTNTAECDYALGRYDESLSLYDRALTFTRSMPASRDEAYSLYGIGVDYYALGDRDRAREYLERSLAIRTAALDARGRMMSLRALATIDAQQGRLEEAIAADREALSVAVAPASKGRIRIQLAAHVAAAGRPAEAIAQLGEELSAGAKLDPLVRAEALLRRGVLLRETGRPHEALGDLAAARPRLHALGAVAAEFEADVEFARALRAVGKSHEALAAVERALTRSDVVRFQTANPEFRAQLRGPLRPAYELKIDLLRERFEHATAAGHESQARMLAARAFATADASRAHTLADIATLQYSPQVRRALAAEFRRREELYRELQARRFSLDEQLDRSGSTSPRSRRLLADIAELERQVDTVNTRIAARARAPGAPEGSEAGRLPALLANTALVSFWLGSESAYAWVIGPGGIRWMRLSSPATIVEKGAAFHRSLSRLIDVPVARRLQEARELYKLVLEPLSPWLDVHDWVVIPDGVLDYVPLGALWEEPAASFVAMRHDVALAPAAWMLEAGSTQAEPHGRSLLLVADPVYQADDPRLRALGKAPQPEGRSDVSADARGHRRLLFTGAEAEGILKQFKSGDTDALIGLDATRERVLALDWSGYRYIHFAAHATADTEVPELSALILGNYDHGGRQVEGTVRLADLALRTLSADVAVFSACDTSLGKAVPGEGLVGISSTVLARGAQAVVASLWPVVDEIGARLMTEFYRHLLQDSMSPAAALGAAMRSEAARESPADPALWAAYQVFVRRLQTAALAVPREPPDRRGGGRHPPGNRSSPQS